jgi:hypothetical protein
MSTLGDATVSGPEAFRPIKALVACLGGGGWEVLAASVPAGANISLLCVIRKGLRYGTPLQADPHVQESLPTSERS